MRISVSLLTLALALAPLSAPRADDSAPAGSGAQATLKIELGRRLFYDADLSINGTMSCATCHEQRHGFADGNRTHPGALDHPGRRNVPGLANVGRLHNLTWADDTLPGLERQALNPMTGIHPIEMGIGGHEPEVMGRLAADPCYVKLFSAVFPQSGGAPSMDGVTGAIAAFERTLVSDDTPWDRSTKAGTPLADPAAERGRATFAAKGCVTCHTPPLFTDDGFHVVRKSLAGEPDLGLSEVSGKESDRLSFRTPGLRNVALTAPYWHDGRAQTLGEAIHLHDAVAGAADLSTADVADVTAFLSTLTDARLITDERFSLPPKQCPLP